jgi:hypothetical protein
MGGQGAINPKSEALRNFGYYSEVFVWVFGSFEFGVCFGFGDSIFGFQTVDVKQSAVGISKACTRLDL